MPDKQQYLLVEDVIFQVDIWIGFAVNDHPARVILVLIKEFMSFRPDMQIDVFNAIDQVLVRTVSLLNPLIHFCNDLFIRLLGV